MEAVLVSLVLLKYAPIQIGYFRSISDRDALQDCTFTCSVRGPWVGHQPSPDILCMAGLLTGQDIVIH